MTTRFSRMRTCCLHANAVEHEEIPVTQNFALSNRSCKILSLKDKGNKSKERSHIVGMSITAQSAAILWQSSPGGCSGACEARDAHLGAEVARPNTESESQ